MRKFFTFCALLSSAPLLALAQFYNSGQAPASARWKQLRTDRYRIIYQENTGASALRTAAYAETATEWTEYGYTKKSLNLPIILYPRNFSSNGIVLWAPKRTEWISTPSADTYATPWLKQLAVHELRHSVQYSSTNQGIIKILSWFMGQSANYIGLAMLPPWMLEGDAVLSETQLTTFGRGLQPSFTLEYRAYHDEGIDFRKDKWFCGSFRDAIPNHYQLGYQLTSYADTRFSHNIWDKIARYSARNPYMIVPYMAAIKKYYGITDGQLLEETKADLAAHWSSLPRQENSSTLIETPLTSYTTYTSLMPAEDGVLLAHKSDFDRYGRFVRIDTHTGDETEIAHTGMMSSRAIYSDGRIYWTEFDRSTLWEQKVNSQLYYMDVGDGRRHAVRGERDVMYPVITKNGTALIRYHYETSGIITDGVKYIHDGSYELRCGGRQFFFPSGMSVHGLAQDERTGDFYFIGLDDEGMWLGRVDRDMKHMSALTPRSRSTLSNLTAEGGRLFFNSIASGLDEVHMFDIDSGREYQVSKSAYGSFTPAGAGGRVYMTTYSTQGYTLAEQNLNAESLKPVKSGSMPMNVVNPERRQWNIGNIDTVRVSLSANEAVVPAGEKRYRKAANLFNFHSWAPVSYDAIDMMAGESPDLDLGASIMSQNLLGTLTSQFGWAHTEDGSLFNARMLYTGLPVKFDVSAKWGGMKQYAYVVDSIPLPARKRYLDLDAVVYMPLMLSGGYHVRYLTPSVEYERVNTLYPARSGERYFRGVDKLKVALQYTDNVRMAHRDFLPRWGYALRASVTWNPFRSYFSELYTLWGRLYTPGIAPHHSLMLRGAVQYAESGLYNFRQKELFPRGAKYGSILPSRYGAVAIDYQLPVWYPEGGISGFMYFKRIRANVGFNYARFKNLRSQKNWDDVNSYGMDLHMDMNFFRLPAAGDTTLSLSFYKPSDRNSIYFGFNFAMPF